MKKINEKKLKKLYIAHCESSAPDMDSIWEKIESELDEKSENRVTSKPVRTFNFRRAAVWCAVCAAVVIAVPAALIGMNNPKLISNMSSDSAAMDDTARYENAGAEQEYNAAEEAADGDFAYSAEEGRVDEFTSDNASGRIEGRVYYSDLDLAYSLDSLRPREMPYAETSGDEFFVEDSVLIETDVIVDAVVDMVYSSGNGTVCYILKAEDQDKNDMGSILVESATPYLMKMNREYILPLKENAGEYSLAFENAPQMECTGDGGVVFHNGWESLTEGSEYLVYLQNGVDDFFYDRMRFSYIDAMSVLTDKWRLLKNNEGD